MKLSCAAALLALSATPALAQITAPVGPVKPGQDAGGAFKSAPRGPVQASAAAVLLCEKTGSDRATLTNTSDNITIAKGSLIEIRTAGKEPPYGGSLGSFNVYPAVPPGGSFQPGMYFNPEFVSCTAKVLK